MNKYFLILMLFVIVFVAGCSGGSNIGSPVEPPRDPETVYNSPVGTDCWKKYVRSDSRYQYVTIYDQDKDHTAFTINWNSTLYKGYFTWSSSDNGKTVAADLYYEGSTNLPATAKIYNYNNTQSSYIIFNGYTYYFIGYVC
ncbi:MAG TPA: hypothetical protein VIK96_02410 [Bacilli bacterium]